MAEAFTYMDITTAPAPNFTFVSLALEPRRAEGAKKVKRGSLQVVASVTFHADDDELAERCCMAFLADLELPEKERNGLKSIPTPGLAIAEAPALPTLHVFRNGDPAPPKGWKYVALAIGPQERVKGLQIDLYPILGHGDSEEVARIPPQKFIDDMRAADEKTRKRTKT